MKTIFTILISIALAVNISIAQVTPNLFDTKEGQFLYLYELINEYRESKGLNTLILDTAIVNACEFHSVYMSFYDIAGHFEKRRDSIHLQDNLMYPATRAKAFNVRIGNHISENSLNISSLSKKEICEQWAASIENNESDYKYAAKYILESWKSSEGHNEALLMEDGVSCGVYVRYYVNKFGVNRLASTFLINNYYPQSLMDNR